ncbi:TPM domain-containing protein [Corynebacterium sp. H78]|uniref:TPM domain-containing protein n=1 Tax=Corynebacterium sp. H78 TaxID=3133417 RepID=UPI0030AC36D3
MSPKRTAAALCAGVCAGVLVTLGPASVGLVSVDLDSFAPTAVAEAPDSFPGTVLDTAGVLTSSQKSDLEARIKENQADSKAVLFVAYVRTFDGMSGEEWAKALYDAQGSTSNTAVVAIATEERNLGIWAGDDYPASVDQLSDAVYAPLTNDDWFGAGNAAVQQSGGDATGVVGLGAGLGGAAVLGGCGLLWARRNKKKRTAQEVVEGRAINPADVNALGELSTDALDTLAQEELVSTDESIRKAQSELEMARNEFGDARVRDLEQALANSQRTLDKAFQMRQRVDSHRSMSESERRSMLLEIVSTCGVADDQLDAEADRYREMREQLMNAPETLDRYTQRTIDLRTRIPKAATVLDSLRARYDATMLTSIADNIDMATEHVNMAEQSIDEARSILERPAGEQAGLVDALAKSDMALSQADQLIAGIEHADSNISQAVSGLEALVAEVRGEVDEARNLLGTPEAAQFDRTALRSAIDAGTAALAVAEERGSTDPLSAWTELTEADADLDEHLASARDATQVFARAMQTLQNSLADAQTAIVAARDTIGTRRRIVGSRARTLLAEAERHYAVADTIAVTPGNTPQNNPRTGINEAREAARLARESSKRAQQDINNYRNQQRGGGDSGALIAGMVLGGMMNGGGGFGGGGFGGGGFGGGGFSGGGGSGTSLRF